MFKQEKDQPFADWPTIGETLIDRRGARRFVVKEINPHCKLGLNVVGLVDNQPYACDVATLIVMWERS